MSKKYWAECNQLLCGQHRVAVCDIPETAERLAKELSSAGHARDAIECLVRLEPFWLLPGHELEALDDIMAALAEEA